MWWNCGSEGKGNFRMVWVWVCCMMKNLFKHKDFTKKLHSNLICSRFVRWSPKDESPQIQYKHTIANNSYGVTFYSKHFACICICKVSNVCQLFHAALVWLVVSAVDDSFSVNTVKLNTVFLNSLTSIKISKTFVFSSIKLHVDKRPQPRANYILPHCMYVLTRSW